MCMRQWAVVCSLLPRLSLVKKRRIEPGYEATVVWIWAYIPRLQPLSQALSSFHTIWLREEPENKAAQISTWYFYSSSSEFSAQLSQVPLVYVRCSLRDAGFHRILVTEVHAETHEALSLCHDTPVILVENVTQDMYIDLDQVCRTVASLPGSYAHTMRAGNETSKSDVGLIPIQKFISLPASFPGLPRFYLPFAFTIIHGSRRPVLRQTCIIVNANGGGLEMRYTSLPLHIPFPCRFLH